MTRTPATPLATAQLIVEVIGFDQAITLMARLGGLTVSLDPHPRGLVASILGAEAAERVHQALGPGSLAVPRAASWAAARRNEEIVIRGAAGETRAELALRFGLTERHVYRILAEASEAATAPTGDLA